MVESESCSVNVADPKERIGCRGDDKPARKTVNALCHRLEERGVLVPFRPLLSQPFVLLKIFDVSPDWRWDDRDRWFRFHFALVGRLYFHSRMRSRYA